MSKKDSTSEGLKGVLFGAITGTMEVVFTYPVKYIKTQLQLEEKSGKAQKYSGVIDCVSQTYKQHGVFGLYRGLNIFIYGPKAAIRFGAFEALKSTFKDENGVLNPTNTFLCGLGAGAVEAVIVNTPLETIETKLINDLRSSKPKYKGFLHGTAMMIREEGFRGVYQGVTPSVIKQASNQGIRFFVMDMCKNLYTQGDKSVHVPKTLVGVFGVFAAFCSVIGNNPIDVVKTRMQGLDAAKYKNTIDCFVQIFKTEGVLSFYRGVIPRMTRVGLEVGLTFMIYETLQEHFNK